MFMLYLRTEFRMPSSGDSVIVGIRRKLLYISCDRNFGVLWFTGSYRNKSYV